MLDGKIWSIYTAVQKSVVMVQIINIKTLYNPDSTMIWWKILDTLQNIKASSFSIERNLVISDVKTSVYRKRDKNLLRSFSVE